MPHRGKPQTEHRAEFYGVAARRKNAPTNGGMAASKATLRCGDEVHRLRLLQFLGEKPPGWDLGKHPELKDGAAHWVESIRRDEEPTDGETHRD